MPYTAGQEIDAFCTRCKIDNVHVIIAVWEGAVKKVQCRSCNHSHLYRRPHAGRDDAPRASRPPARRSRPPEPTPRDKWMQALSGRDLKAARPYSMASTFEAGDLIQHSSFGAGLISRLVAPNKIEVVFEEGTKVLIHGDTHPPSNHA
ncbi:MAG: hypothetical protein HYY06_24175 [Deltaproteobacteria bacterium]|nr:hypothetical protein [Deltaproteobacteria bacterium]